MNRSVHAPSRRELSVRRPPRRLRQELRRSCGPVQRSDPRRLLRARPRGEERLVRARQEAGVEAERPEELDGDERSEQEREAAPDETHHASLRHAGKSFGVSRIT